MIEVAVIKDVLVLLLALQPMFPDLSRLRAGSGLLFNKLPQQMMIEVAVIKDVLVLLLAPSLVLAPHLAQNVALHPGKLGSLDQPRHVGHYLVNLLQGGSVHARHAAQLLGSVTPHSNSLSSSCFSACKILCKPLVHVIKASLNPL